METDNLSPSNRLKWLQPSLTPEQELERQRAIKKHEKQKARKRTHHHH